MNNLIELTEIIKNGLEENCPEKVSKERFNEIKEEIFNLKDNEIFFMHDLDYMDRKDNKTLGEFDKESWAYNLEAGTMVRKTYDSPFLQGHFFYGIDPEDLSFIEGKIISAHWYTYFLVTEKLQDSLRILNLPYHENEFRSKLINSLFYKLMDKIVETYKDMDNITFIKRNKEFYDIDNYIISGIQAAENITFTTFYQDFRKQEKSMTVLNKKINTIKIDFMKEILKDKFWKIKRRNFKHK